MAVTAKARAEVALIAETTLPLADVRGLVKAATARVEERGISIKGERGSVRVEVVTEDVENLGLAVITGENPNPFATFRASTHSTEGKTHLRLGGLESYKTFQTKIFGLIPSGPAMVFGYGVYKRFLTAVAAALEAEDPAVEITIG